MASLACCRTLYIRPISRLSPTLTRTLAISPSSATPENTNSNSNTSPTSTHFKITLTRSGISLGKKVQRTLLALGFHRRFQTVYFPHSPEVAGKILKVKELVKVENVGEDMVMSDKEQREARKASRGYTVVGTRKGSFMGV